MGGVGKDAGKGKRQIRKFVLTPEDKLQLQGQEEPKGESRREPNGESRTSVPAVNVPGTLDAKPRTSEAPRAPQTPGIDAEEFFVDAEERFVGAEEPKGEIEVSATLRAEEEFFVGAEEEFFVDAEEPKGEIKVSATLGAEEPKGEIKVSATPEYVLRPPVSDRNFFTPEYALKPPVFPKTPTVPKAPVKCRPKPVEKKKKTKLFVPRKKYIFNNPFLDLKDGFKRTTEVFPGPPQPFYKDNGSRYIQDFAMFSKPIGKGCYSNCFKALHVIDGCYYALKISIKEYELYDFTWAVQRAHAEIQSMAYLGNHKNIVGYYGGWFENNRIYIQLEYCEETLQAKSLRGDFRTQIDFQNILYQVVNGLNYAHLMGVVHLDMKPANILVKDGVYKIGDFGLAVSPDFSIGGVFFSTAGDGQYNPGNIDEGCPTKGDVFALAVSVYEMMLRHHRGGPKVVEFQRGHDVQIERLPGFSLDFLDLLQSMVDNDPDARPSASEVVASPVFNDVRKLYGWK